MPFKKKCVPWNKGKEHFKNENHPRWKGDEDGYSAIHDWIARNKAKPDVCTFCKKKKKLQAANISGECKRDVNDFVYVCHLCHSKLDFVSKARGEKVGTSKLKEENIKEIFISLSRVSHSILNPLFISHLHDEDHRFP